MKKLMLALTICVLAVSCDSPQRNRLASVTTGDGVQAPVPGNNNNNNNNNNPFNTGATTGSNNGGQNPTKVNPPAGFESCDLSPNKYYAAGIGYMGICQSSMNEGQVAVYPELSDSLKTCLIPTYRDGSGNSTYLGQPQCFLPVALKISYGTLYKTRSGFTGNPINGVMIMKESSLTAYYSCMNAYVNYASSACPYGPRTSAACDHAARALMTTSCNDFKAAHSYLDIPLR